VGASADEEERVMQAGWGGMSWTAFRGFVTLGILLLPGGLLLLGLLAIVLRRFRTEPATAVVSTAFE
jgi:hypothetical protein